MRLPKGHSLRLIEEKMLLADFDRRQTGAFREEMTGGGEGNTRYSPLSLEGREAKEGCGGARNSRAPGQGGKFKVLPWPGMTSVFEKDNFRGKGGPSEVAEGESVAKPRNENGKS